MTGQHETVIAEASDGLVHIVAEPGMARAIADALEFTFASGGLDDAQRPTYLLDCAQIKSAAYAAELQNRDDFADVRYVPVARPHLRLVGGDGA